MDEHEGVDDGTTGATPVPWQFELALWVPIFSVVVWFLFRLFNGGWIDAGPPRSALDDSPDPPDADGRGS